MKSDIDEVALQGIEFWSNVSDEETDLAIEDTEAQEAGRPPVRSSKFYAKGALQYLCPVLMQKLTKQEEYDDEDDWNPSKAAGVCLMLLATCCENDIVQHVLPFVKENIISPDWRYRDAALMSFGEFSKPKREVLLARHCPCPWTSDVLRFSPVQEWPEFCFWRFLLNHTFSLLLD